MRRVITCIWSLVLLLKFARLEATSDDSGVCKDTTSLLQTSQDVAKRQRKRSPDQKTQKYFFFTEHKTGTVLSLEVGCMMNAKLRSFATNLSPTPCETGTNDVNHILLQGLRNRERRKENHFWIVPYDDIRSPIGCQMGGGSVFMNIRPEQLRMLDAECRKAGQDWKAIFLVRDPKDILISAYIYNDKSANAPDASLMMKTGPQYLQHLSLDNGIRREAFVEAGLDKNPRATLPLLLTMYKLVQTDPRILTMRFEHIMKDYYTSLRDAFRHFLGTNDTLVEAMVKGASVGDIQLQSVQNRVHNHVASVNDKARVGHAVDRLWLRGDSNVSAVMAFRPKLGYSDSLSF